MSDGFEKVPFSIGDRVIVIEGKFENFDGKVEGIDETNGRITVRIAIFNRSTPMEFKYRQLKRL
jgi:transcriptional antiterminator NusG